ncbi:hypothetical protein pipiens_015026 [Culex pipiens pipiens]|uniref:Uncharacterized protein n=1 Tax=Culex pipiens pipiens TaxID=38569 RepID=A0ABD1CS86_CULPP
MNTLNLHTTAKTFTGILSTSGRAQIRIDPRRNVARSYHLLRLTDKIYSTDNGVVAGEASCSERDLLSVAYRNMEQIVTVVLIHKDDKPVIMRALLLRHRHVNGNSHGGFHFGPNQKYSSIQSVDDGHGETKIDGAGRAVGQFVGLQIEDRRLRIEICLHRPWHPTNLMLEKT